MKTVEAIRSSFLSFFKNHSHEQVHSAPLVPKNDPTLLFTNAGMVQFKDIFTGMETRPYTRAVSAQKCLRAGGKHNDLENVGYTARHHTFFEMLGNFSFGDYFKEEAIAYAWEFVTKELCLDKSKLLVTVYHEDEEAYNLWKKVASLMDDRIIKIATNDNFWSMGDTGPCGPCSEIFYDHGSSIAGGPPGSADQDGDRFIEIWNLVFMQFEQKADGTRIHLPKPSIDTGMGLERVAAVLQGVHSNYETDLFKALIAQTQDVLKTSIASPSLNVIADHLRAMSFLVADGVLPSNEGRGYVLRRIMRRAMRHGHLLGSKKPFMYQLVDKLVELMGQSYPELTRAKNLITQTIELEEERFNHTLEKGMRFLNENLEKLPQNAVFPGEVAFKLYDTYGFPLDLTQDILKSTTHTVDEKAYEEAMEHQRVQARQAWLGSGDVKNEKVWFDLKEQFGLSEFLGYETCEAQAQILCLLDENHQEISVANEFSIIYVITNQTPFYGESGGQVGDIGEVITSHGKAQVLDTIKPLEGFHVHKVKVINGELRTSDTAALHVDLQNRRLIKSNHSATHLLHAALRKLLGDHVTQKGSLVAADRLRFDFSHPKNLTKDEMDAVEKFVNYEIAKNAPVQTALMGCDDAIAKGAMALFGEKYSDEVRVVSMGDTSIELCGGTHVSHTGDIGLFKIISEVGVAAGVRRIEAITGPAVLERLKEYEEMFSSITDLLKCPPKNAPEKLEALIQQKKALEKKLEEAVKESAKGSTHKEIHNGVSIWMQVMTTDQNIKSLVDEFKKEMGSGIVVIFSCPSEDKVSCAIGVSEDLTQSYSAVDLVRHIVPTLGGKGGGGRPDLAQAGGNNPDAVQKAFEELKEKIV